MHRLDHKWKANHTAQITLFKQCSQLFHLNTAGSLVWWHCLHLVAAWWATPQTPTTTNTHSSVSSHVRGEGHWPASSLQAISCLMLKFGLKNTRCVGSQWTFSLVSLPLPANSLPLNASSPPPPPSLAFLSVRVSGSYKDHTLLMHVHASLYYSLQEEVPAHYGQNILMQNILIALIISHQHEWHM